jgi:hypothetical protein
MGRISDRDHFIQVLTKLSKNGEILVGNTSLRAKLGWDQVKYDRIKSQHFADEMIILGRGRGGSLTLASRPGSKGLSVFVAYSHLDEGLKDNLLSHLSPLQRLGKIDTWHDQKIMPGAEWEKDIARALNEADIVLLLISIDFINSEYCYGVELERALERHDAKEATVVPVILRQCLWQHSSFAKLQAVPKDAKAVVSWSDRDEAFTAVADGIRLLADQLLAR